MWVIRADERRVLIGPVEYDRFRRTVRFRDDIFRKVVQPFLAWWHVSNLDRPSKTGFVLETLPVPGHPDRVWVIRAVGSRVPISPRTGGEEFRITVGQVSPDGVLFRRDFLWKIRDFPKGVFRYRLGSVSAKGDLILPGYRITADLHVIESPEVDAEFQGYIPAGKEDLLISGFHIRSGEISIPLFRKQPVFYGFHLWGSDFGRQLWFLKRDRPIGTGLYMVDFRTGQMNLLAEDLIDGAVMALADGRWAAMVAGREMPDLHAGRREDRVRIGDKETGFPFSRLLGVFPISGEEWAILLDSGVLFMRGLELADRLRIGTIPGFVFRNTFLTVDAMPGPFLIPDTEIPASDIRHWNLHLIRAARSDRLGCFLMASRTARPERHRPFGRYDLFEQHFQVEQYFQAFLLPSMRTVQLTNPGFGRMSIDAGERGFLLLERGPEGRHVAHLYDPSGNPVTSVWLDEADRNDDVMVIPIGWKVFLMAVRGAKDPADRHAHFRLVTLDTHGRRLDVLPIGRRPSNVRLTGIGRAPDGSLRAMLCFSYFSHLSPAEGEKICGIAEIAKDGQIRFIQPV